MVLSRVWHRAFLCCVPFPHVTEHCKQVKPSPFTQRSRSRSRSRSGSTAIPSPEEEWGHTCDQGPTLHWVGQGCRLQVLRDSGLWSLQCLLWMERVVLSSDGCTQLTVRICVPVFPQVLLQFCHSPVTQLWDTAEQRQTG